MAKENKSMLIIRLSALGDVAMTVPVIYSLAGQYPNLKINVVTRPFFARLFINPPSNINVIGVDFKGEYAGVRGTVKLLRRLGQLKPDSVADLHNVLRSWIIDNYFRLKGVKVVMVDKMRDKREQLFKTGEPQPDFVDRYAEVFAKLGYPVTLDFEGFAKDSLSLPFVPKKPAVGIAPFARYFNKTYPAERMKKVIESLTTDGYHVYLFGGRGAEAETLKKWAEGNDRCRSVAGEFKLEEEIALMGAMDAMISMDSSNQHMAALTGTPVVSVWGSTTPACGFMPYHQDRCNAVCLGIECQPCSVGGGPECPKGHFDCMLKLEPSAIVDKVKKIITNV